MPIHLMIVDDHELVREGLRLLLEGTDIQIVAEADNGQSAFEQLQKTRVDVALVDVRMPRVDGFQFLEMLRAAGLSLPVVLMHSVQDGSNVIRRCMELGAKGLLPKGQEKEALIAALHRVHGGQQLWNDSSAS